METLVWESVASSKDGINQVPSTIGVYVFRDGEDILYIGKSVNLKARLLSHWNTASLDERESLIVEGSKVIDYTITDSEFKALLLESRLIQKHLPRYNRIWKDDKSYLYIKVPMKDEFPLIHPVRRENEKGARYFGPFPSVRVVEEVLKAIRRVVPFCRQKALGRYPCFESKLGYCNPCPSEIQHLSGEERVRLKKLYRNNIRRVMSILEGDTDRILKHLYKELDRQTQSLEYEKALRLRNKIYRFEQFIRDHSFARSDTFSYNESAHGLEDLQKTLASYFPNITSLHRIECYDVSNLSQKEATASMVVMVDGIVDKSEYKRFKLKDKNSRSDFDMLEEALRRRLRNNWEKPDLIVVDGGKPQVKRIMCLFAEKQVVIPMVGIAKNPDRLVIPDAGLSLYNDGKSPATDVKTLRFDQSDAGFNLIRHLRDESHRFARNYHLLLRGRKLFREP